MSHRKVSKIMNLIPQKIRVEKSNRKLLIVWNDDHLTEINFGLLRAACPCASCRGGHENMKPEPDKDVFDNELSISKMTEIEKVEMVGSYGLSIQWADGHHYGIYTWPYLRALCNCDDCRKNRN